MKMPDSPTATTTKSRQSVLVRDVIEVVLLVTVIFFAIKLSVETRPVDGISMFPGLNTGQYLFENKLTYVFGTPQRGDVIVFKYPYDTTSYFVKRIIGLPGDTITITPTTLAVNGVQLNEPYISAADNCSVLGGQPCATRIIKLGANQFWVMGDNRPASCDSRVFGELDRDKIVGKVAFVWWPLSLFHGVNTYDAVFAHIPNGNAAQASGGPGITGLGRCN